ASRFLNRELLRLLALDIAGVEIALRVLGDAVHPVQLAGLFQAVGAFRHGPQLQQLAGRVEFHEHLVLWRAAEGAVAVAPLHGRAAAHPDVVVLGYVETPRRDDVAPDIQQLAGLVENLNADVVAIGDVEPALRVHTDRVRDRELARLAAELAPLLDELAGL